MAKPLPSTISTKPGSSPDGRFRAMIQSAVADGVAAEDMVLRLTLRDVSLLTRDPATPVTDISYANGVMRFLGVRVEKGGVPESILDRNGAAT
ncbi:MAG: hypothetical protein JHD15_24050 [Phenylobacterium sp.]|jgi:hypothetical protein|uniref:hypothetical protein n=1 Tax=unclassified Phenylobacterium TaxID=2640670 RepID=UPI0008CD2566|nr:MULTISPECIES: hypothetical protein [unclassified Phenylobacterium]MBJ7413406.1 hypothetical protein [Phenylobacterium sp.]OHB27195.1 MAG: hypothetical protein A2790_00585 [Phenylobacterium sp. RIFCSPHIGHO2_01_FULL_69_31]